MRAIVFCGMIGLLGQATTAFAQEKGDAGVVMGYPSSVGFIYHVNDRFAIRPEVTFNVVSGTSETDFSSSDGDTWALGFAVGANFYVGQWDKLRSYINARYGYNRAETTTLNTLLFPLSQDTESTLTSDAQAFAGSFGAQYSLHERFSVFGEVGAVFSHQKTKSEATGGRSNSNQFGSRTAVGVVFYF
jgi:hypothetical protein